MHPLDLIVIVGVALVIFGPKTLQSISHSAGRGFGHAKDAKDKLMADLPVEELSKITSTVSQIPLSPQQAAHRLVTSALTQDQKKAETVSEDADKPAIEQK